MGQDTAAPMWVIAVVLLDAGALQAVEPITDQRLRLEILSAIFPGTSVSVLPLRSIDQTWTTQTRAEMYFPDAFASEKVYRVVGPPQDDDERCAAQDLAASSLTSAREVRFRIYSWPASSRGDLVAVVQYRFSDAKPAVACPSIARLLRLSPSRGHWQILERKTLDTAQHQQLESVWWCNLTGSGYEELLIESDSGEGTSVRFGSDLYIFDLTTGRFKELLRVPSRIEIMSTAGAWTQTLDVARTRLQHGERFCFTKTVLAADHEWFPEPRPAPVCYPSR
jgi:hypothetical protein